MAISFEIIPYMPSVFRRGEAIPEKILGAEIRKFGTVPKELDVEGGGLSIEYIPTGEKELRRIIFAFNELGLWVESDEVISSPIRDECPK